MGDVLRAEEVDACKENIQPLREGRRASTLKKIVTTTKSVEDIEKERQSFDIRIQSYIGNDPLELWVSYLSWSKETFPANIQAEFLPLAERCIQTFWSHATYKQDARFLRVLLQYAEMVSNPLEIFAGMEQNGIGVGSTGFWKARGRAYEAREDWANAEATYQKGVDVLAKPIEMMKSIQTEFEARMFRRIKAEMAAAKAGAAPNAASADASVSSSLRAGDAENRAPLGALARTTSVREYESGANRGLATAPRPAQAAPNAKKRSADQLEIFVDDEFATEDERRGRKPSETAPFSSAGPVAAGFAIESKKENERVVERWIDNKMPQDAAALAAVRRMERSLGTTRAAPLQVFEDPLDNTATSQTISKPTALKMRDGTRNQRGIAGSNGPYRFTIQSEFYPLGTNDAVVTSNGAKEKAAYDRTKVYPGDGKEYSFEEIRAQVYAERVAAAAAAAAHIENQMPTTSGSDSMDVTQSEDVPTSTNEFADAMPSSEQNESAPLPAQDTNETACESVETTVAPTPTESKEVDPEPSFVAVDAYIAPLVQITSNPEIEVPAISPVAVAPSPVPTPAKSTPSQTLEVFDDFAASDALNASNRSLADEFEQIATESKPNTPSRTPLAKGLNPMQSVSEAVYEPLIAADPQPFVIFEDEGSQEGVDSGKIAVENVENEIRRPLAARTSVSPLTTVPSTTKRQSFGLAVTADSGTGHVNDENDPCFVPSEKPSVPEHLSPATEVSKVPAEVVEVPIIAEKPKKPLQARMSVSTADLIETEAAAVQMQEEAASWAYDPESNNTMSGVTRRTKDAMDEVMGMFQFDKTMTSIVPSSSVDGGFDVTASIVIPLESVNRAMQTSDFAIFEDNLDLPTPAVTAPVFKQPTNLILEPFQDENAPLAQSAPLSARALQPLAPQIFADPVATVTPANNFEVFNDMEAAQEAEEPLVREPSQMTVLLSRAIADEDHMNGNHTSTLNFTMSGMTIGLNADTTTINTQKIDSIVARSNGNKRGNKPSYCVLPLQNPTVDGTTGQLLAYNNQNSIDQVASLVDWKSVSQAAQYQVMKETGLEGVIGVVEQASPDLSCEIGKSVAFGSDEYVVTNLLSQTDSHHGVYLLESESGLQVLAQRGNLYDYWISKRVFTKLGYLQLDSTSPINEESLEELYSTLVDYNRAYVFSDSTWLMWPLKPAQKGLNIDTETLLKMYRTTMAGMIAQRDAKGYEEIVVWYFAQRLLKLVETLHVLGFALSGSLKAEDVCVSAAAIDFSSPSSHLGSRGLLLRNFAPLVDLESYSEGTVFAYQPNTYSDAVKEIIPIGTSWRFEPDWIATAAIIHHLLHGKEMAVEKAPSGKYKSKMAPKIFWNSSLWNTFFETSLNVTPASNTSLKGVIQQIDTHIATKGAPLRFQMSKLQI